MTDLAFQEMCSSCDKRPVFNKKRKLCSSCYQKLRNSGKLEVAPVATKSVIDSCENAGEITFIQNYFTHNEWVHRPAMFHLPHGTKYTPDFYDKTRNVFIEVVNTRQAFHNNKSKYELFREVYPDICFEVRLSTGNMLKQDDNDRYVWDL